MSHLDSSSQVCIYVADVLTASPLPDKPLSGYQWEFLRGKILRAGLSPEALPVRLLSAPSLSGEPDNDAFLSQTPKNPIVIGLGEGPLRYFTGKKSIDKWHMSPIPLEGGGLFLGTFDLGRIQKQYELGLYLELTLRRAAEYISTPYEAPTERFLLNPSLDETISILKGLKGKDVAVDVETGYGQINTVGFAWSKSDAIAINVLPDRLSSLSYYELWRRIADVLRAPSRKIFQNFMYDTSYFSAYGIYTEGEIFDTMHANKVLWPELDSNLGNVGRLYTKRPYWKDDGKVESEEGKKKNWGNVRDWTKHYLYNCRDTSGTFEAHLGQLNDLTHRNLLPFYRDYVQRLTGPAREMCAHGMPLDLARHSALREETKEKLSALKKKFHEEVGFELNPNSPKQMHSYLKEKKIRLPKKYDKATSSYKESSDSSSIKKIRLKYPEMKELATYQEIKALDKAYSTYIDFTLRPDGRLSYSLNITGTETLRWSGGKDGWERGFNIQTIPRDGKTVSIKSMFLAPEGHSLVEIDLRQAESRFVAYDSADKTLIDMLESGDDVHSYVGNAILKQMGKDPNAISRDEFKGTWRQLGKKAGHGLNYGMKASVFAETVFNELDMVISKRDAELITEAYYGLFPGIPRWHKQIRKTLYDKRRLSTPFGWERYFYGRPGDDMFKEGAAFRPQSTIPYLTNQLMLHLCELRAEGRLSFFLIDQVHDSLTLLAPDAEIDSIARVCLDTKAGHPPIDLPGGRMYIPREVKAGRRLSEAEEIIL